MPLPTAPLSSLPSPPSPPEITGVRPLGTFLALSLLWGLGLFIAGQFLPRLAAWQVLALIILYALPILLSGMYQNTIARITSLAGFSSRGWLYWLGSRRLLLSLILVVLSLAGSFLILLQSIHYDFFQWLAFVAIIPTFYLCFRLGLLFAGKELKPYRQTAFAIRFARRAAPVVLILLQLAVLYVRPATPQTGEILTLHDAIAHYSPTTLAKGSSALVHVLTDLLAYYDGLKLFIRQMVHAEAGWLHWFTLIGISAAVFFSASAMLAGLMIPRAELRRIFVPLSDADQVEAIPLRTITLLAAVSVLAVVFILPRSFAALEQSAQDNPTAFSHIKQGLDVIIIHVDGIDYQPGVRKALQALDERYERRLLALEPALNAAREQAKKALTDNVDRFLDWYYSLFAEYMRLWKLLSWSLQDYLADKLREHLQYGEAIAEYDHHLARLKLNHAALEQEYHAEREQVLAAHRASPQESAKATRILHLSREELLNHPDSVSFKTRLANSAGGGIASGVLVAKIVNKAAAKGTLKLAAKPLLKLTSGRLAAASGTAAGAAAGSAIPVIGTAVGAVVGLVTGTLVDFGLLKADESFNRDDFRRHLLDTIEESFSDR